MEDEIVFGKLYHVDSENICLFEDQDYDKYRKKPLTENEIFIVLELFEIHKEIYWEYKVYKILLKDKIFYILDTCSEIRGGVNLGLTKRAKTYKIKFVKLC